MRFNVEHRIEYRYSGQVFLEPHTIRLRPRNDPTQREISFSLAIEPEPAVTSESVEPEGHPVAHAWFEGLTDRFVVHTRLEAETLRTNPFDYLLLDIEHATLPLTYPNPERFAAALLEPATDDLPEIDRLTDQAMRESGGRTADFLTALCRRLYQDVEAIVRDEGEALPPGETWRTRRGSCRDLTVLFNECCRRQGLAARFVSGYQQGDPDSSERHLHAWSEVYLPGGGWRGFDPMHGLAVADAHLALAASATPAGAAPTSGTFRGTGATAEMRITLEVTVSP